MLHLSLRKQVLLLSCKPQNAALQLSAAAEGLMETLLAQPEEPELPHLRVRCHFEHRCRRAAFLT